MPPAEPLMHPSGVRLPFDGPSDAALIIPEVRHAIRSGDYASELIELLPQALEAGDRVLIIGAGLGVVSTLVARSGLAERVIAVEANTLLVPYLHRVHALNGVGEVEIANAVLAEGKRGRVPFFARRDLRNSSLLPHDRAWQQVMMVPFMDLNLILTEEQISLVICAIPLSAARLLAQGALGSVDRLLVTLGEDTEFCWDSDGLCTGLAQRGFAAPGLDDGIPPATIFRRTGTH